MKAHPGSGANVLPRTCIQPVWASCRWDKTSEWDDSHPFEQVVVETPSQLDQSDDSHHWHMNQIKFRLFSNVYWRAESSYHYCWSVWPACFYNTSYPARSKPVWPMTGDYPQKNFSQDAHVPWKQAGAISRYVHEGTFCAAAFRLSCHLSLDWMKNKHLNLDIVLSFLTSSYHYKGAGFAWLGLQVTLGWGIQLSNY